MKKQNKKKNLKKQTVAFQGSYGAYSEIAAKKYFGDSLRSVPQPYIDQVFDEVTKGKVKHGIVPLENSVAGTIHRGYDLLARHKLFVSGEMMLRISHSLLVIPSKLKGMKRLKQIKRVYSHPQALAQCETFFKKHPWMEAVSSADTASMAKKVSDGGSIEEAAIASKLAAKLYSLEIAAERIESEAENYTRFGIISRLPNDKKKMYQGNKVSLLLTLPHTPGSLSRFLVQCAGRGMNLTKVESRPLLGKPWEYMFYIDFEHDFKPDALQRALKALEKEASTFTLLGSYKSRIFPRGISAKGGCALGAKPALEDQV